MAELQQSLDGTLEVTSSCDHTLLELAMGCWGVCMAAMCSRVALHMPHSDLGHKA